MSKEMNTENYIIDRRSYSRYQDDLITLKALEVNIVKKECPIPFPHQPSYTGETLEFDIPEEYQDYLSLEDCEKEQASDNNEAPVTPETISSLETLNSFLHESGVHKFLAEQGRSINIYDNVINLEAKSAELEYRKLINEYHAVSDPIYEFNDNLRKDYKNLSVDEQKIFKLKLIAEGRIEG